GGGLSVHGRAGDAAAVRGAAQRVTARPALLRGDRCPQLSGRALLQLHGNEPPRRRAVDAAARLRADVRGAPRRALHGRADPPRAGRGRRAHSQRALRHALGAHAMTTDPATASATSRRTTLLGVAFSLGAAVAYGSSQVLTRQSVGQLAPPLVGSFIAL